MSDSELAPTQDDTESESVIHPEDPDDEWSTGPVRRGIRLRIPSAILVVLLAVAGGFWGGAIAEKHHNPPSSTSIGALASRLRSARGTGGFGAASGATGSGGSGAGGSGAATGIVTEIQGQTLYLTGSDGSLIKVNLGPSASIQRTAAVPLNGLQTGDTVIVQGTKNSDGTVTATGMVATPQGTAAPTRSAGGG